MVLKRFGKCSLPLKKEPADFQFGHKRNPLHPEIHGSGDSRKVYTLCGNETTPLNDLKIKLEMDLN